MALVVISTQPPLLHRNPSDIAWTDQFCPERAILWQKFFMVYYHTLTEALEGILYILG